MQELSLGWSIPRWYEVDGINYEVFIGEDSFGDFFCYRNKAPHFYFIGPDEEPLEQAMIKAIKSYQSRKRN
jgi:hypothetical protein